ncbi:MAG: hypothetical protein IT282_03820 [Bacteroidetes bacterium]|nr:hypothetical protein [Bacteroidota bacterium]
MKRTIPALLALFLLYGCAAYKQLSPEPPITSAERGYIPLTDDDENFQLEEGNKYYMEVPGPGKDQFYLVVTTDKKWALQPLLTRTFDSGDGPGQPIPDEAASHDSMMVYPIDASTAMYYWVLESVKADVDLTMRYRFVPRWRFTFENKYVEYLTTLEQNTADRKTFNAIDDRFSFTGFDFGGESSALTKKTSALTAVSDELKKLEELFPQDLRGSRDTAFQRLTQLKSTVADELEFQQAYASALTTFGRLNDTRGKTRDFLASAPDFTAFLRNPRIPPRISMRARRDIISRLSEAFPYYDGLVRSKQDISPYSIAPPLEPVQKLYEACGTPYPREFDAMKGYVEQFNVEADAVRNAASTLKKLEQTAVTDLQLLSDTTYAQLIMTASKAVQMLPRESRLAEFERYRDYPAAVTLRKEVTDAAGRARGFQQLYNTAKVLAASISARDWHSSELLLQEMDEEMQLAEFPTVNSHRNGLVGRFENIIFDEVTEASRARAEAFTTNNLTVLERVREMYADSAFTPVYTLRYSAEGTSELARKRQHVQNEIDQIRYYRFPENAIRALYRGLTENIADRGVERARAIVAHGANYKGTDRQIKGYVSECDASVAKAIVRPKEYRRVLALPVTNNPGGTNEYMFRLLLQIPSDAQFPVFDVNIKLPADVARNAGSSPWYSSITINKNPIKNEGRYRITAPTQANGYESMVTPVQMDKGGRNVLEVRFNYPGFRVFEVSTMAQVPIIRKN